MTERRTFLVTLEGDFRTRISERTTVKVRHKVHSDEDHAGLKNHIASVYRMLWHSWPKEYIAEDNHLILPPEDVLWKASRENGEVDNDIQGALEAWCQNYPNTDDERVQEIAHNVRGEPYAMNASDMHHLAKVFLEAHNLGD